MVADDDKPQLAISTALSDLVLLALDHGMASRSDSATLVPFALLECEGARYIHRFAAETNEQGVAEAMAFVAHLPGITDTCAITYDGTITVEGTKFDAILVIGCEKNAANSFVFAQRYDATATPAAVIGSPAIIGTNDFLLGSNA